MSIQAFANNTAGMSAALSIADPKHVWIDGKTVFVFTGSDIESFDPRPTVTKWQFVQACADAGIAEAQIDASVTLLTSKRRHRPRQSVLLKLANELDSSADASAVERYLPRCCCA